MKNKELVTVKCKFKNDEKFITISVTKQQYVNLLELPVIEKCEIIGTTKPLTGTQKATQFSNSRHFKLEPSLVLVQCLATRFQQGHRVKFSLK